MLTPDDLPESSEPLIEAVRIGDMQKLKTLLTDMQNLKTLLATSFDDINQRDHFFEYTALELAILMGRLDFVTVLLDHGADPNAPSANDADALSVVFELERADAHALLEKLLAAGAQPTASSVLAAAEVGDIWATDLLCSKTKSGTTPPEVDGALLAAAVGLGDIQLFEQVAKRHAPWWDFYLQQAFEVAADSGRTEYWERLTALGDPDTERVLRAAAAGYLRDGKTEHLTLLRNALTLNPDLKNMLFDWAAQSHTAPDRVDALLQIALELGADINTQDTKGATALLRTARAGSLEGMRRLIDLGADVHVIDHDGRGLWAYGQTWPEGPALESLRSFLRAQGVEEHIPQAISPADPLDTLKLWVFLALLGLIAVFLFLATC